MNAELLIRQTITISFILARKGSRVWVMEFFAKRENHFRLVNFCWAGICFITWHPFNGGCPSEADTKGTNDLFFRCCNERRIRSEVRWWISAWYQQSYVIVALLPWIQGPSQGRLVYDWYTPYASHPQDGGVSTRICTFFMIPINLKKCQCYFYIDLNHPLQDNMPCSVYRWQLRLRAHNMRERAVSYTASDEAWMGILGWKVREKWSNETNLGCF